MEIPLQAIRQQVASGIDILIHLGRLRDRSRRILEIVEVLGCKEDQYLLNPLYEFEETVGDGTSVSGELRKKGELIHVRKLYRAGISYPQNSAKAVCGAETQAD